MTLDELPARPQSAGAALRSATTKLDWRSEEE